MKIRDIITEATLRTNWTDSELESLPRAELRKLMKQADDFGATSLVTRIQSILANTPSTKPRVTSKLPNSRVMMMIDDAVGNAFPDGDPLDRLIPKITRELGVQDYEVVDVLDKAVRASKMGRNFNDYLRTIWQQHLDDNPELWGDYTNPW